MQAVGHAADPADPAGRMAALPPAAAPNAGQTDKEAEQPQRFAAAIALCGYGDTYMIPRVAKVPVWIFQGEEDPAVPVTRARDWVAELRKAGGAPQYTEYPSIGHNVWDVAFGEPGLAEWMFSHRSGGTDSRLKA